MVCPAFKRAAEHELVSRGRCSERYACAQVRAARLTVRYQRRVRGDELALRTRILKLARKHPR